MSENAAIDMHSVICDAYADLVAGDASVHLPISLFLHISFTYLQVCLINIHIA